ncbi:MAG: ThiF family adenylyltransferase [Sphingomonadales bacterium]
MEFTDHQIERYARHIVLREVGGAGQIRLLKSRVLIIGAGGLGSPLLMYLAAAGVGTIGIIDDDEVSLSNLQRQIVHTTDDLGRRKVDSAAAAVGALNPDVKLIAYDQRIDRDNALEIIGQYDLVADGSDNFPTRFLVNDACYLAGKTLVSAAIGQFEGQLSTYKAHTGDGHPCYRCIFPEAPPEGVIPTCAEGGVIGALAGVMGTLQANEVIKELAGVGDSLSGRLIIYDALETRFRDIRVKPDPACALCGKEPSIRDLAVDAS